MIERFFENPVMPPPEEEKEGKGVEEGEENPEALRICVGCGAEFYGDPKTNEPFCDKCREMPFRPEAMPL